MKRPRVAIRGEQAVSSPVDERTIMEPLETVAGLMAELRQGRSGAAGRLVEVLYPELRRLAAAKMSRERPDHTWQPTALVHELMELSRIKGLPAHRTGEA